MDHNHGNAVAPDIIVQLVHIDGPRKGQIDESLNTRVTIGRDPSNDVAFPRDLLIVSRLHAEIVREGNRFLFICKGKNGCFINGAAATQAYLKQGDVIMLAESGPKISFLSAIKKTPRAAATVPPAMPDTSTARATGTAGGSVGRPVPPRAEPQTVPFTFQYGIHIKSLKQTAAQIGRDEKCDFVLPHPSVHGFHAKVYFAQNRYYISNISTGGVVYINNRPIQSDAELLDNDEIMLGDGGPRLRFLGTGRFVEVVAQSAMTESPTQFEPEPTNAVDDIESHKAFLNTDGAGAGKKGFFKSLFKK